MEVLWEKLDEEGEVVETVRHDPDRGCVCVEDRFDIVTLLDEEFDTIAKAWLVKRGWECVAQGWEVQIRTKKGEVFTGFIG